MNPAPSVLPRQRDLYYGGAWHRPRGGHADTLNPATGESLGPCAEANAEDVDAAVQAARAGFESWRRLQPAERGRAMRRVAAVLREHADGLAMIDALNCGNPVREMRSDALVAAAAFDYCAALATEVRGDTLQMGDEALNLSLREPYGVVGRIVAYNHPLMFTAGKIAPAIAVGNAVVMKPPHQAPLSAYRLMELIDGLLPPGVVNLVTGGREGSEALVRHPDVPRLSLIGSVPTGRAIARSAADRLKHVTLELGGKNACVIYPDADLDKAAKAAVDGMNFTWCGQSCGSTSRLFVHDGVHDAVLQRVLERVKHYVPGIPSEMDTTMGAIVSQQQLDKILGHIEVAKHEGATLAHGGKRPDDPRLARGFFVEPTVFTDVQPAMRIANEEVFGPVLSVLRWSDEEALWEAVNRVEYGLTGSIWTRSLATAHRAAARMQAGFVWVNQVGAHFPGVSFGGVKQSGIGREEGFDELVSFTQSKNVHIVL